MSSSSSFFSSPIPTPHLASHSNPNSGPDPTSNSSSSSSSNPANGNSNGNVNGDPDQNQNHNRNQTHNANANPRSELSLATTAPHFASTSGFHRVASASASSSLSSSSSSAPQLSFLSFLRSAQPSPSPNLSPNPSPNPTLTANFTAHPSPALHPPQSAVVAPTAIASFAHGLIPFHRNPSEPIHRSQSHSVMIGNHSTQPKPQLHSSAGWGAGSESGLGAGSGAACHSRADERPQLARSSTTSNQGGDGDGPLDPLRSQSASLSIRSPFVSPFATRSTTFASSPGSESSSSASPSPAPVADALSQLRSDLLSRPSSLPSASASSSSLSLRPSLLSRHPTTISSNRASGTNANPTALSESRGNSILHSITSPLTGSSAVSGFYEGVRSLFVSQSGSSGMGSSSPALSAAAAASIAAVNATAQAHAKTSILTLPPSLNISAAGMGMARSPILEPIDSPSTTPSPSSSSRSVSLSIAPLLLELDDSNVNNQTSIDQAFQAGAGAHAIPDPSITDRSRPSTALSSSSSSSSIATAATKSTNSSNHPNPNKTNPNPNPNPNANSSSTSSALDPSHPKHLIEKLFDVEISKLSLPSECATLLHEDEEKEEEIVRLGGKQKGSDPDFPSFKMVAVDNGLKSGSQAQQKKPEGNMKTIVSVPYDKVKKQLVHAKSAPDIESPLKKPKSLQLKSGLTSTPASHRCRRKLKSPKHKLKPPPSPVAARHQELPDHTVPTARFPAVDATAAAKLDTSHLVYPSPTRPSVTGDFFFSYLHRIDPFYSFHNNFIVMPLSYFFQIWNRIVLFITLFTLLTIPIEAFWAPTILLLKPMFVLTYTFDLFMIIHALVIQPRLAYYDDWGQLVVDLKLIRIRALERGMMWNLISSIPFEVFALISYPIGTQGFALCRLIRMVRMRNFLVNQSHLHSHHLSWRLLQQSVFYVLVLHFLAGIFYVIGKNQAGQHNWLSFIGLDNDVTIIDTSHTPDSYDYIASLTSVYLNSFYFLITTSETVGYGDARATSNIEKFINIFYIIFLVMFTALTLGFVVVLVRDWDQSRVRLEADIDEFSEMARHFKVPFRLRVQVIQGAKSLWSVHRGFTRSHLRRTFMSLPTNDRLMIKTYLYRPFISQVPWLADCSSEFITEIVRRVRMKLILRKEFVVKQGELSDCMYFLFEGRVLIFRVDDGSVIINRQFSRGFYFGDMGLLYNERRYASVYALTNLELLTIVRDDFKDVLRLFPKEASKIVTKNQKIRKKETKRVAKLRLTKENLLKINQLKQEEIKLKELALVEEVKKKEKREMEDWLMGEAEGVDVAVREEVRRKEEEKMLEEKKGKKEEEERERAERVEQLKKLQEEEIGLKQQMILLAEQQAAIEKGGGAGGARETDAAQVIIPDLPGDANAPDVIPNLDPTSNDAGLESAAEAAVAAVPLPSARLARSDSSMLISTGTDGDSVTTTNLQSAKSGKLKKDKSRFFTFGKASSNENQQQLQQHSAGDTRVGAAIGGVFSPSIRLQPSFSTRGSNSNSVGRSFPSAHPHHAHTHSSVALHLPAHTPQPRLHAFATRHHLPTLDPDAIHTRHHRRVPDIAPADLNDEDGEASVMRSSASSRSDQELEPHPHSHAAPRYPPARSFQSDARMDGDSLDEGGYQAQSHPLPIPGLGFRIAVSPGYGKAEKERKLQEYEEEEKQAKIPGRPTLASEFTGRNATIKTRRDSGGGGGGFAGREEDSETTTATTASVLSPSLNPLSSLTRDTSSVARNRLTDVFGPLHAPTAASGRRFRPRSYSTSRLSSSEGPDSDIYFNGKRRAKLHAQPHGRKGVGDALENQPARKFLEALVEKHEEKEREERRKRGMEAEEGDEEEEDQETLDSSESQDEDDDLFDSDYSDEEEEEEEDEEEYEEDGTEQELPSAPTRRVAPDSPSSRSIAALADDHDRGLEVDEEDRNADGLTADEVLEQLSGLMSRMNTLTSQLAAATSVDLT